MIHCIHEQDHLNHFNCNQHLLDFTSQLIDTLILCRAYCIIYLQAIMGYVLVLF